MAVFISGRLSGSKVNLFALWNLTSHIYLETGSIIPRKQNFMDLNHKEFAISSIQTVPNILKTASASSYTTQSNTKTKTNQKGKSN